MNIKVITTRYPSKAKPYNHMFVHVRNIEYLKQGHSVIVFIPSKIKNHYEIDGIQVYTMPVHEIVRQLNSDAIIFIHLLYHSYIKELDGGVIYDYIISNDIPTLFFIHGIETQKIWKSRRDSIELTKPKSIARFLYRDFYLIKKMQHVFANIVNKTTKIKFVTVSKWAQNIAEETLCIDIDSKVTVIPNGINTKLFSFTDHWKNRNKLLTIRPLSLKGIYAIDLALNTMKYLNNKQISLNIYGKGNDAGKIIKYIDNNKLNKNITLNNTFIEHNKIPNIHREYGIYYAVTRSDTQGVSMCEAMASGMPTISFDTCAIPEFINDNQTGILVSSYNVEEAADKIDELVSNKNLFLSLAENGRASMEKIDIVITTQKELVLAQKI